jgi:hypothetical protein
MISFKTTYKIDYQSIKKGLEDKNFSLIELSKIKWDTKKCPFCGKRAKNNLPGGYLLYNQNKELFFYFGSLFNEKSKLVVINGKEEDSYTLISLGDKCYSELIKEIGLTSDIMSFFNVLFYKYESETKRIKENFVASK